MQLYDITVAVNQTRQLDAPGSYFYYYSGSAGGADSTITLRGISSGLRIILKPGQSFRLPAGQRETSWVMTNYAGAATILGSVLVGDGEIQDNRITGSVEIVDGGKNRSMAKAAFAGRQFTAGQVGLGSHSQIWNPPGSGRNIILEKFGVTCQANDSIILGSNNSALPNAGNGVFSKLLNSGAVAAAQLRYQNYAGLLITGMMEFLIQASNPLIYEFKEPMVINPGSGLVIANLSGNITQIANFEFFEEGI